MNTAIIGGGAAGLCAAIAAAQKGDVVTLFERLDRVGKKILATGNGRCNLMNTGALCYPSGSAFVQKAFAVYSPERLRTFFISLGLALREEAQGRVYPATGQAATVLNVLLAALERERVRVETGVKVDRVDIKGEKFVINDRTFDKLIIAGGGKAQEKLGSDGSCYPLLRGLGHRITSLAPSLTAFKTELAPLRGLSGIRIKANVTLMKGETILHRESGELLFTDYGVSGVCVMQLSAYYTQGAVLSADLRPAMNLQGDAYSFFISRVMAMPYLLPKDFLTGLFATPLCAMLLKRAELTDLSDAAIRRLAYVVENYTIPITALCDFTKAQVTKGGADLSEFDPETMGSRLHKHLYAAGEVLDVDGDCGGFNLMFACISGIIAARSA